MFAISRRRKKLLKDKTHPQKTANIHFQKYKIMEHAQIQEFGKNYAYDNAAFFFKAGMTAEAFSKEALENYNSNAEAFNQPSLPKEQEADFLFGAKESFTYAEIKLT